MKDFLSFVGLLMSVSKAADVLYAHFEKSKDTFDKVCFTDACFQRYGENF